MWRVFFKHQKAQEMILDTWWRENCLVQGQKLQDREGGTVCKQEPYEEAGDLASKESSNLILE